MATTLVLIGQYLFAQQNNFECAMKSALTRLDSAKTIAEMEAAATVFERIGIAEANHWEPYYYHAFASIQMSFQEKEGSHKDALLDKAQKSIDQAWAVHGDPSELHTLQGYLYQGRIQVSAMRGMIYSQKAAEVLEQAKIENPKNPRALFLLGQNIYHTPKMFGGGSRNALAKFKEAQSLFEAFRPKTELWPQWGACSNKQMADVCLKEID